MSNRYAIHSFSGELSRLARVEKNATEIVRRLWLRATIDDTDSAPLLLLLPDVDATL